LARKKVTTDPRANEAFHQILVDLDWIDTR
jgi:hypothetical protein